MLKHAVEVFANVRVREAQSSVPSELVHFVATLVSRSFVRVAVDLNDQPFLRAEEVDHAISDDVLTSKFEAPQLRAAEVPPELRFKRC
jgi:hypothetical protein